MTGDRQRFEPGDVVVGDWAWGLGAHWPHPVIRVNRDSITVGIHRDRGGWLTTHRLRWGEIRGVIPAEVDHHADLTAELNTAAARLRYGYLSDEHRESLATLLLLAGAATLPTPIVAVLHHAISTLSRAPGEPTGS